MKWSSIQRWKLSLLLVPYKVFCVLVFLPDPSISIVWRLGIVPYGPLWMIINWPSKYSLGWWAWWVLFLDVPITMLAWKYLPTRPLVVYIYLNCLFWLDDYTNMSILWLAQFGVLNPVFTLLSILAKLPIPGTPNWDYAFQPFHFVATGNTRVMKYATLLFTWIYSPSEFFFRRWRNSYNRYSDKPRIWVK